MIFKINNNISPSYIDDENKVTAEFNEIENKLSRIENAHLSLFLPPKNKSFIYKIVEKIKSILNLEKKIGSINTAKSFKSPLFLTDDICNKKVRDLDEITISKKQLHDFIIDLNNKSISFNWFVEQYVRTKGDLLLVTKVAHFLEDNRNRFNPLKLIAESACIPNCLPLFNLIITESTSKIKKEIFFDIINDYFDENKARFDANYQVKNVDFLLDNNYLVEWSDELKNAFKKIMGNMINKNIDLNFFLKGVVEFELIDVEKYFNHYGTAEHYVKVLNNTIEKYILDYPRKDVCDNIIKYIIDSKNDIEHFFYQYLNKIDGDLFIGINKEQYLIRVGQILDFFSASSELSEE